MAVAVITIVMTATTITTGGLHVPITRAVDGLAIQKVIHRQLSVAGKTGAAARVAEKVITITMTGADHAEVIMIRTTKDVARGADGMAISKVIHKQLNVAGKTGMAAQPVVEAVMIMITITAAAPVTVIIILAEAVARAMVAGLATQKVTHKHLNAAGKTGMAVQAAEATVMTTMTAAAVVARVMVAGLVIPKVIQKHLNAAGSQGTAV
jgi:hypothetical protein